MEGQREGKGSSIGYVDVTNIDDTFKGQRDGCGVSPNALFKDASIRARVC